MALDDLGGVVLAPSLGLAACGSNAAMVGAPALHLVRCDPVSADVVMGTWFLASRFAVAFPGHAVQLLDLPVQHLEIHVKGSLIEIMTELLGSTVWRIEWPNQLK